MNPLIKKIYLLEAWDYNETLKTKFFIQYLHRNDYKFAHYMEFSTTSKNNLASIKEESYKKTVQTEMDNSTIHKNVVIGLLGKDFLNSYYSYFFFKHPEYQLELLKYHTILSDHQIVLFDFLDTLDSLELTPLLKSINQWSDFSKGTLNNLENLMNSKNYDDEFKLSIYKILIDKYTKTINSQPILSSHLEEFLDSYYRHNSDSIIKNITAITNRRSELNTKIYYKAFTQSEYFCISNKLNIENLLKALQINSWGISSYTSIINVYHEYLINKHGFKIETYVTQNQKEMNIYIKMKTSTFTMDDYQKDLLSIFSFCRSSKIESRSLIEKHIASLLLQDKLSDDLETKKSSSKIKI